MTSRNRSMAGVETTCTYELHSLIEGKAFLNIINQALQVAECGMPLVAMIDVFLDTEFLQSQHTSDTQKNLLLQTVFPVTAIK